MTEYVIIGAGIAGLTAAKTIRQHDPHGEIVLYSNEYRPMGVYRRKDMLREMGQSQVDGSQLLLETPESLEAQGISFQYENFLRVFPETRQILKAHHLRRGYDKLLLAIGTTPKVLDVPGAHLFGVTQIRHFSDVSMLQASMPDLEQTGVVIIGGGILGMELAHTLRKRGITVTQVVREGQVGAPFLSENAARQIESRMIADGVTLLLNREVKAYHSSDNSLLDAVELVDGLQIPTHTAIAAIGTYGSTEWLDGSDLTLNEETGLILVNQYLQTNLPDIYAAGTVAQFADGNAARTWAESAEQGKIAALNMLGIATPCTSPIYWIDPHSLIYDLPFAELVNIQSRS